MKKILCFMLICILILTSSGTLFAIAVSAGKTTSGIPYLENVLYSEDFSESVFNDCIQVITNNVGSASVENGELKLDKTTAGQWVGARFWLDSKKDGNSWRKTGKYVIDYTIRRDNYNYLIMRVSDAWTNPLLDMVWNQNDVKISGLANKTVNSSVYGGDGKSLRVTVYYNMDDRQIEVYFNNKFALSVETPDPVTANKGGFMFYQIWTEHNINTFYLDNVSICGEAMEMPPQFGKKYYCEDFSDVTYDNRITPVVNGVGEVTVEGGKLKFNKTTSGSWIGARFWLAESSGNGWRAKGKYLVDYTMTRDDTSVIIEDQIRGANQDNYILMNWKSNAVTFSGGASKTVNQSVYGGDGKTLRVTAYYNMDALKLMIWLNGRLALNIAMPEFSNGKGGMIYHQPYTQAATGVFYIDDLTVGDVFRPTDKIEPDISQNNSYVVSSGACVYGENALNLTDATVKLVSTDSFLAGSELFINAKIMPESGKSITLCTAYGVTTQTMVNFSADGKVIAGDKDCGTFTPDIWHDVKVYVDSRGNKAIATAWIDGIVVADGVELALNQLCSRDTLVTFVGSGCVSDIAISNSPLIFENTVFTTVTKSEDSVYVKAIGGEINRRDVVIIAALYSQSDEICQLDAVNSENYIVTPNKDFILEVAVPSEYRNGKTLKIFLWDDESGLMPLSVPVIF